MDVFEDKESTESGSPVMGAGAGVGADRSGVVPQVMNRAVSMSMEKSLGVVAAAPAGGGAGGGEGEGAIVAAAVVSSGGSDLMNSSGKRKRGRPRKYDSDGNLRVPYIAAAAAAPAGAFSSQPQPTGFTLTTPPGFSSTPKRGRGRPAGSGSGSGSGNWKSFASSLGEILATTAGGDFTPHVVTVYAGEDVAGKILSFAQTGSRGLCVLSANGSVSNATIRQPGSSGGILTYEGRFEILSLTGSYTTSENGGIKGRTGGLSVSLAGPDGRVIGGGVAGLLMAASPIQVVLGSFTPNNLKPQKRKYNMESRMSHAARPTTQATPAAPEINTAATQLPAVSQGETDNNLSDNNKDKANQNPTPTAESAHWNGSALNLDQRPSPDINLSVSIEQQQ